MTYATELAKELKSRNNIERIGNLTGEVLSVSPFKVGILNNTVFLDKNNCFICSNLIENYTRNATINSGITSTIIFEDILKVGDKVLVVSESTDQFYYIVDKVVKIDV